LLNALQDTHPSWNPNPPVSSSLSEELLNVKLASLLEMELVTNALITTVMFAIRTTSPSVSNVPLPSLFSTMFVSTNVLKDFTNLNKEPAEAAVSAVKTAMTKEIASPAFPDSTSPKDPTHVSPVSSLSFLKESSALTARLMDVWNVLKTMIILVDSVKLMLSYSKENVSLHALLSSTNPDNPASPALMSV
jgi:hypothetical protein